MEIPDKFIVNLERAVIILWDPSDYTDILHASEYGKLETLCGSAPGLPMYREEKTEYKRCEACLKELSKIPLVEVLKG